MTLAESNILIVDDEPILQLTFRLLLEQQGARVYVAGHGGEALEVLRSTQVDVMLTDRQMPVMDGKTLLRSMAAAGIRVPSILFVNGADPEDPGELEYLHVVDVATKPLHPEDLVRRLTAAVKYLPAAR